MAGVRSFNTPCQDSGFLTTHRTDIRQWEDFHCHMAEELTGIPAPVPLRVTMQPATIFDLLMNCMIGRVNPFAKWRPGTLELHLMHRPELIYRLNGWCDTTNRLLTCLTQIGRIKQPGRKIVAPDLLTAGHASGH